MFGCECLKLFSWENETVKSMLISVEKVPLYWILSFDPFSSFITLKQDFCCSFKCYFVCMHANVKAVKKYQVWYSWQRYLVGNHRSMPCQIHHLIRSI